MILTSLHILNKTHSFLQLYIKFTGPFYKIPSYASNLSLKYIFQQPRNFLGTM